jgi:cell division protein FtsN
MNLPRFLAPRPIEAALRRPGAARRHAAAHRRHAQRGGFAMGLIVGLLVGLALALGVALYVTKAPNPFVNKVPQRSAVQDAAEAERNRNWDPNAALAGKNPARTAPGTLAAPPVAVAPALPPSSVAPSIAPVPPPVAAPPRSARASAPAERDSATAAAERAPAVRGTAPALSTGSAADPFSYFVQAGAYARSEDAEQQRAKLAMLGIESRLTEREQAGRTVFRVRVGPFERKDEADSAKEKLNDAGIDSALVRVQK